MERSGEERRPGPVQKRLNPPSEMDSSFQHVQMAADGKIQFNFIDITSVTVTESSTLLEKLALNREKP